MSRLLLQCRRTLVVLRQQATVKNEMGLFSMNMDKCAFLGKDEKPEVTEEKEQKRS
ncbi:hypothetical protein KR009_003495 [Drosophila setifemur]|nr:hypothetical protein KR009_003495 [Drosophila setifemur]